MLRMWLKPSPNLEKVRQLKERDTFSIHTHTKMSQMSLADAFARRNLGYSRCLGLCGGWGVAVVRTIPDEVFVAAQVLQFHSLDLVVIKMKLLETVWKIWWIDKILLSLFCFQVHLFISDLTKSIPFFFGSQTPLPCCQKQNCDFQCVSAHLVTCSQTFSLVSLFSLQHTG